MVVACQKSFAEGGRTCSPVSCGAAQIREQGGGVGLNPCHPSKREEAHQAAGPRREDNSLEISSWRPLKKWISGLVGKGEGREFWETEVWAGTMMCVGEKDYTRPHRRVWFLSVFGLSFLNALHVSSGQKEELRAISRLLEVPSEIKCSHPSVSPGQTFIYITTMDNLLPVQTVLTSTTCFEQFPAWKLLMSFSPHDPECKVVTPVSPWSSMMRFHSLFQCCYCLSSFHYSLALDTDFSTAQESQYELRIQRDFTKYYSNSFDISIN